MRSGPTGGARAVIGDMSLVASQVRSTVGDEHAPDLCVVMSTTSRHPYFDIQYPRAFVQPAWTPTSSRKFTKQHASPIPLDQHSLPRLCSARFKFGLRPRSSAFAPGRVSRQQVRVPPARRKLRSSTWRGHQEGTVSLPSALQQELCGYLILPRTMSWLESAATLSEPIGERRIC